MWNKITLTFLFLLIFVVSLIAHPLGNFSVNNFTRLEIEKDQIKLHSFLDMAEVPTFQTSQEINVNNDKKLSESELKAYLEKITPEHISNLKLFLDDKPLTIQLESKEISVPLGSGKLPILKAEWELTAKIPENTGDKIHHLRFENNNFRERVGWKEIVIERNSGINVFNSTAFGSALSNELKTYPKDMLTSPLTEREAELSFTTSDIPADAKKLQNRNGTVSSPVEEDPLATLISEEVTPFIIMMGLLLAFGLGAMHAMSPGHGKTVVGAYLVGSQGTMRHAMFLGLTVTITHTLGVFALGLITLFASQFILPESLMPFLSFISGLLVFFIGLSLFKSRIFSYMGYESGHEHHHDHAHFDEPGENKGFHHEHNAHDGHEEHSHPHDEPGEHSHDDLVHTHDGNTHSHLPPEEITWKSLLGLGISGGLLPCPSALVLMLAAINLNRIGYGLVLTVAFSVGLAATLICVGLAFLYLGKLLDRPSLGENPIVKALPVFSAFVITCLGAVICYNSYTM